MACHRLPPRSRRFGVGASIALSAFLAAGALPPAAREARAQDRDDRAYVERVEGPLGAALAEADDLAAAGRYLDAARRYQAISERLFGGGADEANRLVLREPAERELDKQVFVSLAVRLRERLAALPPEGREALKRLVDARAGALLAEAEQARDVVRLEEIVGLYLFSSSGPRAALLLGDIHLEAGRPVFALSCYELIARYRAADVPGGKAALELRLGLACAQAGPAGRARRHLRAALEAAEAAGPSGVTLAAAARSGLEALAGPRPAPSDDADGFYRPSAPAAQRNHPKGYLHASAPEAVVPLEPPSLTGRGRPREGEPGAPGAAPYTPDYLEHGTVAAVFPSFRQGTLVANALRTVVVVSPSGAGAERMDLVSSDMWGRAIPYGWTAAGTAVAGDLLYAAIHHRRLPGGEDGDGRGEGRPEMEMFAPTPGGLDLDRGLTADLYAFDARRGYKLIWTTEEPDAFGRDDQRLLGRVSFRGVPFAFDDSVVAGAVSTLGERGEVFIFGFDSRGPRAGRIRWRTFICVRPSHGYAGDAPQELPQPTFARVGSVIYVSTGAGVLAALDAYRGEVLWAVRYRLAVRTPWGDAASQGFYIAPPLVYEGEGENAPPLLVASPRDSDALLAYDLATGRPAWRTERQQANQVLGFWRGHLALVGNRIDLVRATDGSRRPPGEVLPEKGLAVARGALCGDHLYIPVRGGILAFVLEMPDGGTPKPRMLPTGRKLDEKRSGNVVVLRDRLLIASPLVVTVFFYRPELVGEGEGEKPGEKPPEKPPEKPGDKPADRSAEKPRPAAPPAEGGKPKEEKPAPPVAPPERSGPPGPPGPR